MKILPKATESGLLQVIDSIVCKPNRNNVPLECSIDAADLVLKDPQGGTINATTVTNKNNTVFNTTNGTYRFVNTVPMRDCDLRSNQLEKHNLTGCEILISVINSAGKARLWSRNRLSLAPKFPMVLDAVSQLKLRSTILDREIVALDAEGLPRFQLLQQWQKRPTAPVVYFLFDLLWFDGRDLTGKTVMQRRKRLQEIITPIAGIQVGGYVENRGIDLFQLAKEKDWKAS